MTATTAPELRMGHDIARQFAHLPAVEAAEAIATHVEKFWTPAMRRRLVALTGDPDADVDPVLAQAAAALVLDHTDDAEIAEPSGG